MRTDFINAPDSANASSKLKISVQQGMQVQVRFFTCDVQSNDVVQTQLQVLARQTGKTDMSLFFARIAAGAQVKIAGGVQQGFSAETPGVDGEGMIISLPDMWFTSEVELVINVLNGGTYNILVPSFWIRYATSKG